MPPNLISQNSNNKKSPIAERIAFDPFLPQQDIINELIRNTISPDMDVGQTYYLGQVVGIITDDNQSIENRDIFYNQSDNFERATKDVSDKKYNLKRIVLLVHIPSFITNGKNSVTDLNYYNFQKLRVEYILDGKSPEVGNLVKIQFRDKISFSDPKVIEVEKISSNKIVATNTKAKDIFDAYLGCKQLAIDFPSDIGSIDYNSRNLPAGGYAQALKEIDNIFSPSFIKGFIGKRTDFGDFTIIPRTIRISDKAHTNFNTGNYKYISRIEAFSDSNLDYLIRGDEIIFSSSIQNKTDELVTEFYKYVTQEFSSKLNYILQSSGSTSFIVDMNLDLLSGSKNIDNYVLISNKLKSSTTYYSRILPSGSSPKNITKKLVADECDNKIASGKEIYKLIYDGQTKNGGTIVKSFYENPSYDENQFINTKYFYKLVSPIKKPKDIKLNNFYHNSSESKENSKDYQEKKSQFGILDLDNRFNKVSSFLKEMKKIIFKNEGVDEKNVLIVPKQVLKM